VDCHQHGHAVAATAAASKNDVGIHGIAFNASALAVDDFSHLNESHVTSAGILYHVSDPWTYITSRSENEAISSLLPTALAMMKAPGPLFEIPILAIPEMVSTFDSDGFARRAGAGAIRSRARS
jgi:hypothetical protein